MVVRRSKLPGAVIAPDVGPRAPIRPPRTTRDLSRDSSRWGNRFGSWVPGATVARRGRDYNGLSRPQHSTEFHGQQSARSSSGRPLALGSLDKGQGAGDARERASVDGSSPDGHRSFESHLDTSARCTRARQ